jgi:hypothetical protein
MGCRMKKFSGAESGKIMQIPLLATMGFENER